MSSKPRYVWLLQPSICYVVGLFKLENLNLSFTGVTDGGLKKLSGLSSLKSLNLDARQITDIGLASLTGNYAYNDALIMEAF